MELIQANPAEITDFTPWLEYLSSITSGKEHPEFTMAYGQLLANDPSAPGPHRLLLWGPGQLVTDAEFSLYLFFSLTSTISGLEPGRLEEEHPRIRFHPCFHSSDYHRLARAVQKYPNDHFVIVGINMLISNKDWITAALSPDAATPWPALNLLKWLHQDWNVSDVNPRIEALRRWSQKSLLGQNLKVVN